MHGDQVEDAAASESIRSRACRVTKREADTWWEREEIRGDLERTCTAVGGNREFEHSFGVDSYREWLVEGEVVCR